MNYIPEALETINEIFKHNNAKASKMHHLLRQIAAIRDLPGINNSIVKSVIDDVNEFVKDNPKPFNDEF